MVDAEAVGRGPRSADQECASGFFPLSTLLGSFLPEALLFACSLLVVACELLIAPCYGRSVVTDLYIVITRIKAAIFNALSGLLVDVVCNPIESFPAEVAGG
jgi:hypothetical protein